MASYRRLPNRKWQAEVLLPVRLSSGRQKRITKTHMSKGFLREWATKLEADIDAGRYTNQRAAEATTVRDMHEVYRTSRMVSDATRAKTESFWRNHVEPAWGGHPVADGDPPRVAPLGEGHERADLREVSHPAGAHPGRDAHQAPSR